MNDELHQSKRSLFRRIFSFKSFFIACGAFVALIIVVIIGFAIFNARGQRTYEKIRAEDEARGETYQIAKLLPKTVPDGQNFMMTPLLAPLLDYERINGTVNWTDPGSHAAMSGDYLSATDKGAEPPLTGNWEIQRMTPLKAWQDYYHTSLNFPLPEKEGRPGEDILLALDRYKESRAELVEATKRPYSQARLDKHADEGFGMLLPHLAVFKKLAILMRIHAVAALDENKPDIALEDLRVGFRLMEAAEREPILISHLVQIACMAILEQPIWEGMVRGKWNSNHLAEIQQRLESVNQFQNLLNCLRGERAFGNTTVVGWMTKPGGSNDLADAIDASDHNMKKLLHFAPRGFFYYNLAFINQFYREILEASSSAAKSGSGGRTEFMAVASRFEHTIGTTRSWKNILARLLIPALSKSDIRTRRSQATINLATAACALERFKIDTGKYPASLSELSPKYISKTPLDAEDGKPLRYHLEADGKYLLYSVGTDGKDQGGEVSFNQKHNGANPDKGDIVWSLTAME